MPRRKRSVAADPVPPIPQNIESLVDPAMKRRAELLWRHCGSLRAAVDGQLNWFRQLRDTGDADPGEALRLEETVALCCGTLGPIIDRIVPGLMDEPAPPSPGCEPGWQAATLQEYHANNCAMGLHTLYGVAGNIAKALEHDAEPLPVAVPTSCHAALSAPATTPPADPSHGEKTVEQECYVTFDTLANYLRVSKKTMERRYKHGKLCEPDIEGGGGKAHQWKYSRVRPFLETAFDRQLPERWPGGEFAFRD